MAKRCRRDGELILDIGGLFIEMGLRVDDNEANFSGATISGVGGRTLIVGGGL